MVLDDVIETAETVDTVHMRKESLAAIEELKEKGPNSKRELSGWGQVGQGALSMGCVVAAATGQIELGIPCVLGGAAYTAGPAIHDALGVDSQIVWVSRRVLTAVTLRCGRCIAPFRWRRKRQGRPVERAPHLYRVGCKGQPRRWREHEGVPTAADAGAFEIAAIAIGQNLTDQSAADINVETDRRFGMIDVLRPAFDDVRRDPVDKAAQIGGQGCFVSRFQSGAHRKALPDRPDLVAFIKPSRAIARDRCRCRRWVPHAVFMGVVEQAAAVIVDEAFRKRAFGDDHVVGIKLDVEIFHSVDPLGLHDGARR